MVKENSNVMGAMLQSVRQVTEANLRLQQDVLLGWSRYWPGFTGRQAGRAAGMDGESQLFGYWCDSVLRVVEAQRSLVGQQYDAAIEAIDSAGEIGLLDGGMLLGKTPPSHEPPAPITAPAIRPTPAAVSSVEPATATEPAKEPPKAPVKKAPAPKAPAVDKANVSAAALEMYANIRNKVAVVTGAASGIGEAVSRQLAQCGVKGVLLVDRSDAVNGLADSINDANGRDVAVSMIGDTTDEAFRKSVFDEAEQKYGVVTICVPAAGITRDALSVTFNKETGKTEIYPVDTFRQVTEVNLIAPIYWGIEMVARISADRRERGLKRWDPAEKIQGVVVFLGSVSSQGNKGQISYAVAKAGLEGAAATLTKEAIFHGVRCGIIHPGFTDTPMAQKLGDDFLNKNVLPYTQLRRLIRPEEIADAICFMISNSAITGELWADAGWHPPA